MRNDAVLLESHDCVAKCSRFHGNTGTSLVAMRPRVWECNLAKQMNGAVKRDLNLHTLTGTCTPDFERPWQ